MSSPQVSVRWRVRVKNAMMGLRVERLYRDPVLQRFHSWRLRTGDIGFMILRRLCPLPPNTGSEDPGPGSLRGNPRGSSPHFAAPCGVLGYRARCAMTERTAYFASIACASHNWLSAQVTLPWFKSSDFAAAESSW